MTLLRKMNQSTNKQKNSYNAEQGTGISLINNTRKQDTLVSTQLEGAG